MLDLDLNFLLSRKLVYVSNPGVPQGEERFSLTEKGKYFGDAFNRAVAKGGHDKEVVMSDMSRLTNAEYAKIYPKVHQVFVRYGLR